MSEGEHKTLVFGDQGVSKFIEGRYTELKEQYTDDIKKEIIAFLNSKGGTLYIGVSDSGKITGLANADKTRNSIDNILADGIYPCAVSLAHTEVLVNQDDSKQYVKCIISEGTEKPYHFKHSRLTPDSVYIRVGSSCVAASDDIIEQLLRETRKGYETLISAEQNLSFAYATKVFSEAGIQFEDSQKISLKMKTTSGMYTNLGLLFSDQCPHIIKAASFKDENGFDFISREDFVGSILMQLDYAFTFAKSNINMSMSYDGLTRIDRYDYPIIALREALLNAIMHRDYSSPSATQFKIFSNRMEIVSFGGLVNEMDADSIKEGISSCRNPYLAAVLARLQLVESFGTGIPKILAAYKGISAQPEFIVKPNLFKIVLPKLK